MEIDIVSFLNISLTIHIHFYQTVEYISESVGDKMKGVLV